MAKNVFRPTEIVNLTSRVSIEAPYEEEAEEVKVESIEEYKGPTADDLRREAEAFTRSWEVEKTQMVSEATTRAEAIIKNAESAAFEEIRRKKEEAEAIVLDAQEEARKIIADAQREAEIATRESELKIKEITDKGFQEGFEEGRNAGYQEGKDEADRLIRLLHTIVDKAIEKRNELISEAETQVINLVLLIARKVIKVISENQKNVVINNVIQSLRKLKSRGDVVVKVNLEDVDLTSEHINDFMRMVENVRSITVLEDSTVDKGGCIIETDFGQIDARISSQLNEIEERIIELSPIRAKGEK
ncbi:MAG: flagellar assembly protein FliH [Spirochaetales bacterium]|nr:flagellar assembly protein FliH [Spirochaetales bacterium]